MTDRITELAVPQGPPLRLDVFLARSLPLASRQAARDLIGRSFVTINGKPAAKGHLVHPHDVVRISGPAEEAVDLTPEPDLPVALLFEDDAIVAVDKPPGMPSVALDASDRGTVSNFLIARHPELALAGPNPREAGLVHRLDTATSGVLLACRTADAYRALRAQFRDGTVEKDYLALVVGDVRAEGTVDVPIAHLPRHPRRMLACAAEARAVALGARPASTAYRPIARVAANTLLAVRIRTGVRHQIRVHLASIGHPIVGETLYGRNRAETEEPQRLMLHALRISFRHPSTGRRIAIEASIPPELALRTGARRPGLPEGGRGRPARGKPRPAAGRRR